MACACKVNRDIELLNRRYGINREQKKTNIRDKVSDLKNKALIILIEIIFLPFMLVYFPIKLISSIRKNQPTNIVEMSSKLAKIFK